MILVRGWATDAVPWGYRTVQSGLLADQGVSRVFPHQHTYRKTGDKVRKSSDNNFGVLLGKTGQFRPMHSWAFLEWLFPNSGQGFQMK